MVRMQPNAVLFPFSNCMVCSSVMGKMGYITHHNPNDMSQNMALVYHMRKFSPPNLSGFMASDAFAIARSKEIGTIRFLECWKYVPKLHSRFYLDEKLIDKK